VAFIASHAQLGGAEGVLLTLLAALGEEWRGEVLVLGEGPLNSRLEKIGVPAQSVHCGRRAGLLTGALRVRRILVKGGSEVVHANGVKAALVAVLATRGTGKRVVWHKHDSARDGRLGNWIARHCALVVGVSHATLSAVEDLPGVRSTVVHNGISVPDVDRGAARALMLELTGAPADGLIVGIVGRLHPGKGQMALVEICAELRERLPDMRVAIAGAPDQFEPGYADELRARIAELGLEGRVAMLGFRDDPLTIVAGCDLLAMPSTPDPLSGWREGFPLAPLEAMAAGTPVAAYDEPGIAEVVGDCAELVPTGDQGALRDTLANLLGDGERRAELAACGRRRVERFSIEAAAEGMMRAYESA
jgi:glycosyltransferase involved in cell wall biosynthesis